MGGVVFEVAQNLAVRRIVRVGLGHGIIEKFREQFRANHMSCLEDAGMSGPGIIDPVATEPPALLQDDDVIESSLAQVFGRSDTGRAGTDDADLLTVLVHSGFNRRLVCSWP